MCTAGNGPLTICPPGEQCQLRVTSAQPTLRQWRGVSGHLPPDPVPLPTRLRGPCLRTRRQRVLPGPGPCPKGTICHNTLGSFQCLCPAGGRVHAVDSGRDPAHPRGWVPSGGQSVNLVLGRDSTFHLCLKSPRCALTGVFVRSLSGHGGGVPWVPSSQLIIHDLCQASQGQAVR